MNLELWTRVCEIGASLAVVTTLIIVIFEVRDNAAATNRQVTIERAEFMFGDLYRSEYLPSLQVKIHQVDGTPEAERAFMERYKMSHEEAIRWTNFLFREWSGLLADYSVYGTSNPEASSIIRLLLRSPDQQLYWELALRRVFPDDFVSYVENLRVAR